MFIAVTYIDTQVDGTSTLLLNLNVELNVTDAFDVFLPFLDGYGWGCSSVIEFLLSIWEALGLVPTAEGKVAGQPHCS